MVYTANWGDFMPPTTLYRNLKNPLNQDMKGYERIPMVSPSLLTWCSETQIKDCITRGAAIAPHSTCYTCSKWDCMVPIWCQIQRNLVTFFLQEYLIPLPRARIILTEKPADIVFNLIGLLCGSSATVGRLRGLQQVGNRILISLLNSQFLYRL